MGGDRTGVPLKRVFGKNCKDYSKRGWSCTEEKVEIQIQRKNGVRGSLWSEERGAEKRAEKTSKELVAKFMLPRGGRGK